MLPEAEQSNKENNIKTTNMMKISSFFDSGNIEVISCDTTDNINLKIRKDTGGENLQWFYFRLTDAQHFPCKINIINASESSYPFWENYHICASYDRQIWFRVNTSYDGKVLTIHHTPEYNSVYYSYFAPYTYEQHLDLVNSAQISDSCVLTSIGNTVQGRTIELLTIGNEEADKKKIWIIARQHPGESMAEWFAEGLIRRLLDEDDSVAMQLLKNAVFYIVPNMNLDGSIIGNHRLNAKGKNLNREWLNPTMEYSPEVYQVKELMLQKGVDLFLDIHGDEEIPYVFASTAEGVPGYDTRINNLENAFRNHWMDVTPDFQTTYGYPIEQPGEADLSIAQNFVMHHFQCLSLTIEMPFSESKKLPNPVYGWSPERSMKLGESVLNPILHVMSKLG